MPMQNNCVRFGFRNYKCFGNEVVEIHDIKPLNLLIGRNNSGKSSVLDIVEGLTKDRKEGLAAATEGKQPAEIRVTMKLTRANICQVFNKKHVGVGIPGANHLAYGSQWIDSQLTWRLADKGVHELVELSRPCEEPAGQKKFEQVAAHLQSPLVGKQFRKLASERDIVPETHADLNGEYITEKGDGATNLIHWYLIVQGFPEELVEETLLGELNAILQADAKFNRIMTQVTGVGGKCEVLLEEEGKGRFRLSQTGSGLKTVILVLLLLHLIPDREQKGLSEYVFAFEELENNLHPALQRRLFLYLRDFAVTHGCKMFITTHSSVVIDLLSEDENTQILHISEENGNATIETVDSYLRKGAVLDDLGVRASDLLQANGIVWIEGPSDRLYFNRWVELWSNGDLQEEVHYQCVPYGGSLRAHLTAEAPDEAPEDLVKILQVNRNAIMIADSDKADLEDSVNSTKTRLAAELAKVGGMSWITAGREVENYLPKEAVDALLDEPADVELGQFEKMKDYLNRQKSRLGDRFVRDKVGFARMMLPELSKVSLESIHDLAERVGKACKLIRKWNDME